MRFWQHEGWWLAPAGRVVLVHHAGGDAPALAHRQAVLFRPRPDITRALAGGRGPPCTAGLCPARASCVLNVLWIAYGAAARLPTLVIPNTVVLLVGMAVIVVAVRLRRQLPGNHPADR